MSALHSQHDTPRPHISPGVFVARDQLAAQRAKLRQQHDAGSPGIQVCNKLTTMLDEVVVDLYEAMLADLEPNLAERLRANVALVPNGGFGRRDSAPYSDLDLMLLYHRSVAKDIDTLAKRMVADLGDTGLSLGFNVRQPDEIAQLAFGDASILTSLAESRFLVGNQELYEKFAARYKRQVTGSRRRLIPMIEQARREERAKYGESPFLLEPNVKRSRGGLRDIQFVRWLGFVRYGQSEPETIQRAGHLSKRDYRILRDASEFLMRLRNELHFHAGSAHDLLDRAQQMRVSELFGYEGDQAVLPVERFMQQYFHHTSEVRNVAANLARRIRPRPMSRVLFDPLLGINMDRDFRMNPSTISANRRGMDKVTGEISEVLRLMDLASMSGKRIDDRTWEAIRQAMIERDDHPLTPKAIERFLSLLSQPGQLGDMLRKLHELRVLEKLEPGFKHARNLLQFNEYHKLTVDAHCIRAVEVCTEFQTHPGRIGQVYRSIKQKRTLHLALLLHDLGKGFVEDHSEVGRRIAKETAGRLQLPEREARRLEFLIHKHLMMSHLAFRRDTSDEQVVVDFAVSVGSPDRLKMLYCLTAADLGAVGPGVLNDWKLDVLTQLYHRTMRHLAGDASLDTDEHLHRARGAVRRLVAGRDESAWFNQQIDALSPGLLDSCPPEQIVEDLARLKALPEGTAVAWGRYLPHRNAVEYTIGADGRLAPGLFHRLTGALTAQRMQILTAEINTLADGLVLDRFYVDDGDHSGAPPEHRLEDVSRRLVQAAQDTSGAAPNFSTTWGSRQREGADFARLPTQVRFDNDTSERYTVIDVFAHDRTGLLYAITRTLYECGVSISIAKIGTYLDQVVDVFYVTDQETGEKIVDDQRADEIRQRLFAAIDKDV